MVLLANSNNEADSIYNTLLRHINSPIPIVLVNWCENFIFNKELLKLKDYVLFDFCEYGWDIDLAKIGSVGYSHIWGKTYFSRYYTGDWVVFDNWVKENPPKLIFKRELLKKDVSDIVKPIEYPCLVDPYPMQLKHDFNNRPVNAFQYWGRSNENRIRIHGEIWLHGYKKGFQPCDNIYFVNNYMHHEEGEKWITLWIPHWARIDISELMKINSFSKLSLSWKGAGFKCFRTAEAPVNSVMVMQKNNYAWSYSWDETNCILVDEGREIEGIEEALSNPRLYDIYLAGMQNVNKYRLQNYIPYLEKQINAIK